MVGFNIQVSVKRIYDRDADLLSKCPSVLIKTLLSSSLPKKKCHLDKMVVLLNVPFISII